MNVDSLQVLTVLTAVTLCQCAGVQILKNRGFNATFGPPHAELTKEGEAPELSVEAMQKVVAQNQSVLQSCFVSVLRTDWQLAGRIELRIQMDPTGAVTQADAQTSTFQPLFESRSDPVAKIAQSQVLQCLLRSFKGLRFPGATGAPVWVSYPVYFEPRTN